MITLYHETTRQPVEIDRFLGDHLLVKRYTMPEKVGLIFTPSAEAKTAQWGMDRTQTLWEVLVSNAKAEEVIGMPIPVGSIVQTLRRWPIDLHLKTFADEHCFLLSPSHCEVRGVISYAE